MPSRPLVGVAVARFTTATCLLYGDLKTSLTADTLMFLIVMVESMQSSEDESGITVDMINQEHARIMAQLAEQR